MLPIGEINYLEYEKEVIRLRQMFHQIPELCEQEEKTCAKIVEVLESYGIHTITKLFGTGVVALLGDPAKPCIALRADMDGLPVTEETGLSYASVHQGKMHACGHDAHIAILLTVAKILKDREDQLPCGVKLIFQPAEEGDGGALPMISEGVLQNPAVTKIFGAHVWPNVPAGVLEYVTEAAFAGSDRFELKFCGKGGHGAMPDQANPPLFAMAQCITELHKLDQEEPNAVVSACACHADGFYNVFPSDAIILGTIRTISEEDRNRIIRHISSLARVIGSETGVAIEFCPIKEYSPCYHHEKTLEELIAAAEQAVGKNRVRKGKPTYAAEDFAYFANQCPAAHIRIGCSDSQETSYPLHHPKFNISDACLMAGVKLFCNVVWNQRK